MLRGLAWLQPPLEVVRLGVFMLFVVLGLFAWRRGRAAADRLIAYVLAVSLAVGLSQQESWPFSNWALVHGMAPRQAYVVGDGGHRRCRPDVASRPARPAAALARGVRRLDG